jgi:hypothetical protein
VSAALKRVHSPFSEYFKAWLRIDDQDWVSLMFINLDQAITEGYLSRILFIKVQTQCPAKQKVEESLQYKTNQSVASHGVT